MIITYFLSNIYPHAINTFLRLPFSVELILLRGDHPTSYHCSIYEVLAEKLILELLGLNLFIIIVDFIFPLTKVFKMKL